MTLSRRGILGGAAALAAAVVTPEMARAAAAQMIARDWTLAVADLDGDIAPRAMRLVHGRAPRELEGTLFRNGPGKFRRPGRSATHWFDGDGLMRSFRIDDGQVTLRARFADTMKRRLETRLGAVVTPGFGTVGDPRAEFGSADDASPANTSAFLAGDRLWALWEGGSPLEMDPETLGTGSFVTFSPELKNMPFQAHPRRDADGSIWNMGQSGRQVVIWRLNADGGLSRAQVVDLPRASYFHDFTATDRHLIIVLQPWVFERFQMPFSSSFAWKPELGSQVLVLDKADLTRTRLYELPTFSFFHLGDAWAEADGTIQFDLATYENASFSISGGRAMVEGRITGDPPPEMALVTLRPDGRADLVKAGVTGEFPKGDPRRPGSRRALSVHVNGERGDRPLPTGLSVRNWERGTSDTFLFGDHQVMEEAVFAPKPGRSQEAEAWLVAPSINLKEGVTELHAFEAGRVADGPVATWRADVALPAGFHGDWKAG